jgi:tol-pal system protein YbgF
MLKRFIFLMCVVGFIVPVHAKETDVISMMSVKQRLERMERLVSSDVLMEQAQQMEMLREEITLLREQLDQQSYELDTIKQRQRSLYLDMDRRLQGVETGGRSSRTGSSPVPPPVSGGSSNNTGSGNKGVVSAPAGEDENGKASYDKAFGLLKDGSYKQSISAFGDFLKAYPGSKYSDNAQYWLGEANYAYRQYKQALSEFQTLIAKYPDSLKIPGARLKIGYVYYELKNWSAARESLQQVIQLFPEANVAKKAQERLERMKREGH